MGFRLDRTQVKPGVPGVPDDVGKLRWGWGLRFTMELWGSRGQGCWKPGTSQSKRGISRVGDHGSEAGSDAGSSQEGVEIGTTRLRFCRDFQINVLKALETIQDTNWKRGRCTSHGNDAECCLGNQDHLTQKRCEQSRPCASEVYLQIIRKANYA